MKPYADEVRVNGMTKAEMIEALAQVIAKCDGTDLGDAKTVYHKMAEAVFQWAREQANLGFKR